MALAAVHVIVTGRVQGVGYRNWARWTAVELGLSGWVRNRRTGEVEAVFSGPAEAVERMLAACRTGPPGARVDAVEPFGSANTVAGPFEILPTV